jgi:hypothetical protein
LLEVGGAEVGPEEGEGFRESLQVKAFGRVKDWPSELVTVTAPEVWPPRGAPGFVGTWAFKDVALKRNWMGAASPPTVTAESLLKFPPVMLTVVGSVALPVGGEIS